MSETIVQQNEAVMKGEVRILMCRRDVLWTSGAGSEKTPHAVRFGRNAWK